MKEEKNKETIINLIILAMEYMDVAATIIDTQGILLYYNKQAEKILDRKPDYIGLDVHSHHKKPDSNKKFDLMLQDFQKGRTAPFHYEAKPYGEIILVTLSPIVKNGNFIGCIQTVRLKEDVNPNIA
jgi:DUF438 domain-containing protein